MSPTKEKIRLSDHFTYKRLIRFALPSAAMMVFNSIYSIVDGYFVANFVGKTSFAAVNFIVPPLFIVCGFGFWVGAGGSALVGKTLGEGDRERANRIFSMLVRLVILVGIALSIVGFIFIRPAAKLLGATPAMLEDAVLYGRIMLAFNIPFMLQTMFQSLLITAERPKLGFAVTVMSGVTNIVLDALLVGALHKGIAGAAIATGIAETVGCAVPLCYFCRKNNSQLRIVPARFELKPILRTLSNGVSEFVGNISSSVVGVLFNMQLLRYAGENGVAAYGVVMYISFIFVAIDIGYNISVSPIVSFHYGAQNHAELQNLLKKSAVLMGGLGAVMTVLGIALAEPLARLYVGYDPALCAMTTRGFIIFSFCYLFAGFNIFASGFFTALNNGLVSAIVSFLRTLVFQFAAVLILPLLMGVDGIWWAGTVSDVFAFAVSLCFLIALRNRYHYWAKTPKNAARA